MIKKITLLSTTLVLILVVYKLASTGSVDTSNTLEASKAQGPNRSTEKPATLEYNPSKPLAWNNHPHMVNIKDSDPRIKSIREAHETKKYPERLSVLVEPSPFELESWNNDKDYRFKYIHTIEPGRIHFHIAKASKDTPVIKALSPSSKTIEVNGRTELQVKASPNSPVTFHAFDGGIFIESRLSTITVEANSQGIATVNWYATPGTLNLSTIIASSPLSSGQQRFLINVSSKDPLEQTANITNESK